MVWAEDKQRMRELGTGMMVLIVVLLLLCDLSIFQMSLVWRAADAWSAEFGETNPGIVLKYKILAILNVFLYIISAFALLFSKSKWAVFFTISAIVFCMNNVLFEAFDAIRFETFSAFPIYGFLNLAILITTVCFLLFSEAVETNYHTGTRKLLTRGVANLWRRIRGRPTLDEIDAARLDQTFN